MAFTYIGVFFFVMISASMMNFRSKKIFESTLKRQEDEQKMKGKLYVGGEDIAKKREMMLLMKNNPGVKEF